MCVYCNLNISQRSLNVLEVQFNVLQTFTQKRTCVRCVSVTKITTRFEQIQNLSGRSRPNDNVIEQHKLVRFQSFWSLINMKFCIA